MAQLYDWHVKRKGGLWMLLPWFFLKQQNCHDFFFGHLLGSFWLGYTPGFGGHEKGGNRGSGAWVAQAAVSKVISIGTLS